MKRMRCVLQMIVLAGGLAFASPSGSACPNDMRLPYIESKGVEISRPLTVDQVEALAQTGPGFSLPGMKPYGPENADWQALKAKRRTGDHFVQFWRRDALVERTKFYMDGLYLVRRGCVIGWVKGAVS